MAGLTTIQATDKVGDSRVDLNNNFESLNTELVQNTSDTANHIADLANPHQVLATQITDFDTEVSNNPDVAANTAARHDVATVTDTVSVDLTLTGQDIKADVLPAGVDHDSLANVHQDVNTTASPTFVEPSVNGVNLDSSTGITTPVEGSVDWNPTYKTLNIHSGLGGYVNQVGQELANVVINTTGLTVPSGKAIRIIGVSGGYPSFELALAETHEHLEGEVLITTTEMLNGAIGAAVTFGRVNDVDTSGFSFGPLFVSATTAGDLTSTSPTFPDYSYAIGAVEVIDAVNGVIAVDVKADVTDTYQNFFNGTFREPFDFRITSDGVTITGSLEPSDGHDDMTMLWSTGPEMLDTNPALTITLTGGSDATPQDGYVFVPISTKVLTYSTSGYPMEEYIPVAEVLLASASRTQTDGALKNQNINNDLQSIDNNIGRLQRLGQRIRAIEAEWESGVACSLSGAPTSLLLSNTSGTLFQMNLQNFPAKDMGTGDVCYIINDGYLRSTDLANDLADDSEGASLNNRWFSLVVWAVGNKSGEKSQIIVNLPSGSYASEEGAISDSLGYANYTVPKAYKGTGFLLARFSLRKSGTTYTYNSGVGYQDLRGFIPNTTAGSGAGSGGVTEFTSLTDTPSAYTGEAGSLPQVNVGETALEFIDPVTLPVNTATQTELNLKANIITSMVDGGTATSGSIQDFVVTTKGYDAFYGTAGTAVTDMPEDGFTWAIWFVPSGGNAAGVLWAKKWATAETNIYSQFVINNSWGEWISHSDDGVLNVKDFGATANGITNDTTAFQNALNQASTNGGGVVFVPQGVYNISTNLNIPSSVTLEGVWKGPPTNENTKGTTLLAVDTTGGASGTPFITMNLCSTLKGISIYHPNQVAVTPIAYPWTIRTAGDNATIKDCFMVNPYQGVDMATNQAGRHLIDGLYGQPLLKGISISRCLDVTRFNNIHFWPFWNATDALAWTKLNGTAFEFLRTDWQQVSNTFCLGYNKGYCFDEDAYGVPTVAMNNVSADACHNAIYIDASSIYGIQINNGKFVGDQGTNPVTVKITSGVDPTDIITFNNCNFWGTSYRVCEMDGGIVKFNNSNFRDWTDFGIVAGGDYLTVNSCSFPTSGTNDKVYIENTMTGAVVTSNTHLDTATKLTDNLGGAATAIANNVA